MVVCQYFLKGDCRFGDKCRYEHPSAKQKAVCPHFMNGNCRFGDKCWNEHPTGKGSGGFVQQQQSGGFRQGNSNRGGQWGRSYHNNQNRFEALSSGPTDTFGNQHPKATDSEQTISQIQKTIENDMDIWGKSKQWPLSCYTYTKEEPCLQGLLDFSCEEIRFEAYKANADGKADSYQQGLKDLISANQLRRHQLGQMSVSQIQEEIKKQTKLQGSAPMDAGLSMQQTSTPLFGQSGGSFGDSSSLIQSSGFPAVAGASNQSGNLFGSGNATSQSGLFGSGNATSQSGLFGSGNATSQSGLFGSGNATSQSGLFGSGNATSQSGLFGQSSVSGLTGSVFGNNANSTNQPSGMTGISSLSTATNQSGGVFGTSSGQSAASAGLFGSASPTTSSGLFSNGPQLQKNSGTISASHTSNNSMQKSTQGTSSSTEQSTVATPVSLTCSEEDMQAFMADSFVLGKIPECPPPIELC
ncbi:Nucleoporin-like protein 2 [Desmophyllum pertusum]|uniref:Nucleoporin NUP42 n=1 Tax=Desmophyllum pertusum TaxID=174260 RepID=A0A9W9ZBZ2_9CNID|nr:Nucleoporin-like protein 2 [Desmophyllum pertusum]